MRIEGKAYLATVVERDYDNHDVGDPAAPIKSTTKTLIIVPHSKCYPEEYAKKVLAPNFSDFEVTSIEYQYNVVIDA